MDVAPLRVRLRVEIHASGAERHVLRHQIRRAVDGIGEPPGAGGSRHQPRRPRVVGVIDPQITLPEQQSLRVAVGFHRLVEVQMVPAQIRIDPHGELDTVHPVQHQRVGGYLHHHMGAPGVGHLPQQLLQLEGLRRGALRGEHLAADHVLDGADQPHLRPGLLLQNTLDEIGGGGLAAGAGHAHHGQLLGGMVKAVGSHHRQRPPGVRHPDEGRAVLRHLFAQDAHRALFPRHGDIFVTVCRHTGDGDEQIAALHVP